MNVRSESAKFYNCLEKLLKQCYDIHDMSDYINTDNEKDMDKTK